MKLLYLFFSISFALFADSNFTNLREESQIKIYEEVTSKIRCICLPSLPIKSCSYSNCNPSAVLKKFIEDRIKKNESADYIVEHIINGYGEEILKDPYIQKMLSDGYESIVAGIVRGYGNKMLAEPDAKGINFTLFLAILGGLGIIITYIKKRNSNKPSIALDSEKVSEQDTEKYLKM